MTIFLTSIKSKGNNTRDAVLVQWNSRDMPHAVCWHELSLGKFPWHGVSSPIVIEFISKEMACFVFDARSESSKHRPVILQRNFFKRLLPCQSAFRHHSLRTTISLLFVL
jgi:hypothetical protein